MQSGKFLIACYTSITINVNRRAYDVLLLLLDLELAAARQVLRAC